MSVLSVLFKESMKHQELNKQKQKSVKIQCETVHMHLSSLFLTSHLCDNKEAQKEKTIMAPRTGEQTLD